MIKPTTSAPAIFRLAKPSDSASISDFTRHAQAGLTTVPRSEQEVSEIIELSMRFLGGDDSANRLLFVAEHEGKPIGISSLIPTLGLERPFYSFKRSRHARRSTLPKLSVKYETLQLTTDFDGYTELASLFISEGARGLGLGRLLSYGRIAFINAHRDLFEDRLMADIRGWTDEAGNSPFWTHLTSKFIPTSFENADKTSTEDGRFIVELLPSLPIILNTLPEIVAQCTGRANEKSVPALEMLKAIGFKQSDLCDVFDGGPSIECRVEDNLIAHSAVQASTVNDVLHGALASHEALLHFTGEGENFMAVIGQGDIQNQTASRLAAQALGGSAEDIWLAQIRAKTTVSKQKLNAPLGGRK